MLVLPAAATAETFFVNTPEDFVTEEGLGCEPSFSCTLRDAIERANAGQEADEIFFSLIEGSVLVIDEENLGPLPAIEDSVTIDGSIEGGQPGIAIVGSSTGDPESFGLEIFNASGVIVRGLAIGGFGAGIAITAEGNEVTVCGNRIGVDLSGQAAPNGTGIRVGGSVERMEIGGLGCGPNLISNNLGAGIVLESGFTVASIGANSIFANGGLGIEIEADDTVPRPSLSGATPAAGSTVVTGTLAGAEPESAYHLHFFANVSCDPSGSGEGQTYLGRSEGALFPDEAGALEFTVPGLAALPPGQDVITAIAGEEVPDVGERVSEFSTCLDLSPDLPMSPIVPFDPPQPLQQLLPENGETLAVEPTGGAVFIRLPGRKRFVRLREGQLIPVGSVVDATKGKVTLTSINKAGVTQTAVFSGGRFLVAQREGSGLVTLRLRGNLFCKGKQAKGKAKAKAKGSEAAPSAKRRAAPRRKPRRLWGSGKGRFRTQGNYGSATVRGTVWLTEDRCGGTFFKVRKGVVAVRDFPRSKTLMLGKGKSYLAKP